MSDHPPSTHAPQPPSTASAPYPTGPYPTGPYPTGPYPTGPYPTGSHPGPPHGLAITALVLGIVAVVSAFIPIWSLVAIAIGIAAVVLGIVAVVKKQGGLALAGLIVGSAGVVVAIALSVIWGLLFFSVGRGLSSAAQQLSQSAQTLQGDDGSNSAQSSSDPSAHTVKIAVSGTAREVSVDYLVGKDSDIVDGATLPWSKTLADSSALPLYDVDAYSDSDADGTITCTITVDGKVVDTDTESGPGVEAYCTYSGAGG